VLVLILVAMADQAQGRRNDGEADSTRFDDRSGHRVDPATVSDRVDLASNAAGVGVAFEAVWRRKSDGEMAARSWDVGAKGERAAGQMLTRLTTLGWWDRIRGRRPVWRVLHSVKLRNSDGGQCGDIDHIVIGPPGIVTINTKHHPRGKVLVDGDTVTINGRRTAYVAKARQEAERARSALAAALAVEGHADLAAQLPVQPLILVVGTMPRVRKTPDGVPVVPLQRLLPSITTLPARLGPQQVEAVFEVSRREATWTIPA
jgi:hypothetical protein